LKCVRRRGGLEHRTERKRRDKKKETEMEVTLMSPGRVTDRLKNS
jgi:hypothetical protein